MNTVEKKARKLCWKECKEGEFVDPENGCFRPCDGWKECTTWRSFMHMVKTPLTERTK